MVLHVTNITFCYMLHGTNITWCYMLQGTTCYILLYIALNITWLHVIVTQVTVAGKMCRLKLQVTVAGYNYSGRLQLQLKVTVAGYCFRFQYEFIYTV